jgi:hypothetical protein
MPFITERVQPTLHCSLHMLRDYYLQFLSDPTAILGDILTKNCFGLKSKVPFLTDRLQSNLHCLQHMHREYQVLLHSDPTAILGR